LFDSAYLAYVVDQEFQDLPFCLAILFELVSGRAMEFVLDFANRVLIDIQVYLDACQNEVDLIAVDRRYLVNRFRYTILAACAVEPTNGKNESLGVRMSSAPGPGR